MGAKFEIFKDKSKVTGKAVEFRWRLIHTNGQVIANSGEGYTTKENAISGINSLSKRMHPTRLSKIRPPPSSPDYQSGKWQG